MLSGGIKCGRRDSNPHAVKRQILSLVRLPITPLPQLGLLMDCKGNTFADYYKMISLFYFKIIHFLPLSSNSASHPILPQKTLFRIISLSSKERFKTFSINKYFILIRGNAINN